MERTPKEKSKRKVRNRKLLKLKKAHKKQMYR